MKTKILIVLLFINLVSSCQNKTQPIMQNSEITEKNIVNKLASNIHHYDDEPMYQLLITNDWCSSEILVNDILAYKNFQEPLDGPTVDINNYIFKNGAQKVTIRLYPVGKYKNKDIDKFIAETGMSITVNEYNARTEKDKEIVKYSAPRKNDQRDSFEAIGKTYYEASFIFNATIPYKVEGFENARDLREWDAAILHKKLLQEYNKVKAIYQNKNYDNIARISYANLKNQVISKYQTREYINEVWEMLMEVYKLPTFEMQPIENYKMVFFADGKLVALMQDSKDSRVRGNSSLWAKFNRGEGIETLFCNRYFYIPKGETEFKIY
ncbi:hypothetical protein [uncultured Flavobacterium sp.]|uniref:hypothetical protein n=1 Tax=uncultured Flavobacterium sp. TaxID=165435 RepID=UPI0025F84D03|nr:hypothetical protein [uncultured Flavobacterium sp.]